MQNDDRNIGRKFLREYSLRTSLEKPEGVEYARKAEKYLEDAIKTLQGDINLLKNVVVQNNERVATFVFQASKQAADVVKARVQNIPQQFGMVDKQGNIKQDINPFIGVENPDIRKRYYAESSFVVENERVKAAAQKMIQDKFGFSEYDPEANILKAYTPTSFAMSDVASNVDMMNEEVQKRFQESVQLKEEREKRKQLIARTRDPGTEEFKQNEMNKLKASDARKLVKQKYIQENPDSPLAIAEKEKQDELAAKEAAKAKKEAQQALKKQQDEDERNAKARTATIKGLLRTLAAVLVASYAILNKILKATLETAENTLRIAFDSSRTNIYSADLVKYENAAAMLGLDKSVMGGAYGSIVSQFSDVTGSGFSSGIEKAAILLQQDTGILTGLALDKYDNPKDMFMDIIASVMNASLSGRGGAISGKSTTEAHMINMELVKRSFGDQAAALINALWRKMEDEGTLNSAGRFTGADIDKYMLGLASGSVLPNDELVASVEAATRSIKEFEAFWNSLKDNVFMRLLTVVEGIAGKLEQFLMPLVMALAPDQAVGMMHDTFREHNENKLRIGGVIDLMEADDSIQSMLNMIQERSGAKDKQEAKNILAKTFSSPSQLNISRLLGPGSDAGTWAEFLATGDTAIYASYLEAQQKLLDNENKTIGSRILNNRVDVPAVKTYGIDVSQLIVNAQNSMLEAEMDKISNLSKAHAFNQLFGSDRQYVPSIGYVFDLLNSASGGNLNEFRGYTPPELLKEFQDSGVSTDDIDRLLQQELGKESSIYTNASVKWLRRILDSAGIQASGTMSFDRFSDMADFTDSMSEHYTNTALAFEAMRETLPGMYSKWLSAGGRNTMLDDDSVRVVPSESKPGTLHIIMDVKDNGELVKTLNSSYSFGSSGIGMTEARQFESEKFKVLLENTSNAK